MRTNYFNCCFVVLSRCADARQLIWLLCVGNNAGMFAKCEVARGKMFCITEAISFIKLRPL